MIAPKIVMKGGHYSRDANLKELEYREKIQLTEDKYATASKWIEMTNCGVRNFLPFLEAEGIRFQGKILEIGAGACWLSSELSKIDDVETIYALDFSETLLRKIGGTIMEHLKADVTKITCIVEDFHQLDFPEDSLDFVVCDAVLHHSDNLQRLLRGLRRVLKKEGRMIAMREPMLPNVGSLARLKKKSFGTEEKAYGVTENIYSQEEWRSYFDEAGFSAEFLPFIYHDSLVGKVIKHTPLRYLNGLVFNQQVVVARRRGDET